MKGTLKKSPKRRLIYSNFFGEFNTEEYAREWLFEEYCNDPELAGVNWESVDDIPDEMVWKELSHQDEISWEDAQYELEKFFDPGYWILQGSFGLWWGRPRGGFIFDSFKEMAKAWNNCDYIRLYDENGHFYIDAAHHDGTNCYEVKRLTEKGREYIENHKWDPDEEVHDVVFNSNIYSGLPHYAHKVWGCKEREWAA